MTFTQLTYLVALDEHRHFSQAAEACHVSQPTLSVQLRKLEDELGVALLDRSHQPIVPTGAGERLIAQARTVLAERDRLQALAEEVQERVTGTLRLGLLPTLSPYLIPLILPALETAYPDMTLVLREWPTAEVLDALQRDILDVGLIATDEAGSDFHVEPLFTEPFVGYVAPDHRLTDCSPLDVSALSLDDLWLLSEGHCFRDQVLQICSRHPKDTSSHARLKSGSLETLVRLVQRSGGMTLLPALATCHMSEHEQSTYVRQFASPPPSRTIRLVTRRRHKERLLHALKDTVRAILSDVCGDILPCG
ncbi:transcriptional regulator [Longimonas halophila]|uniref:Transcriptional regulator n=1 Tax=Longimonas halophila TaxID=1469170 RepID=A0A2H3P0V6_9BACT|nr:LysR substrate-binding domain-containing protein [Longimonas halophila]PEN09200.1 transcriptional regulator [Longimonas halophila]